LNESFPIRIFLLKNEAIPSTVYHMTNLSFTVTIEAPASRVWDILWNDISYRHWTSAFQEGSYAVSDWKPGSRVHFISSDGSGIYATIDQLEENALMSFKQIGEVKNFEEQPVGEKTSEWSGALETYRLTETGGITTLLATVDTLESFADYFDNSFPQALNIVKQLSEGTILPAITVTALVNVPVEKVWAYWSEPAHITQWNNASDDWHTPVAENDLRTGGSFRSRMEAKDGSFGFDFRGVYDEVITNQLIAYTMEDGRKVRISFSAEGETTQIKEKFEAETENSLELQRDGWQAILNNFKKYAEANR
jgi:uncharacterized protein YndB with AHSA1/START domain